MATYGEGDPTDNAQELYEWLQNDRDDLDCLNYAVSKNGKYILLYFILNSFYIFTTHVHSGCLSFSSGIWTW